MKRFLVLYPHGLGDCILLTPALREYYSLAANKVHIATLERFKSAEFFKSCPYVDKIFYTKDAWADFPNSQIGFQELKNEWKEFAAQNGFMGVVMPMHSSLQNKILINGQYLGIRKFRNFKTEVFTTEEDKQIALKIVNELVGTSNFGFIQTDTGLPAKNLSDGFGKAWLNENRGLTKFIEIDKDYKALDYTINIQFEIMRLASGVCLPDSVFYHACHAMEKPIDFVYFGRGPEVYERVRPLHKVKENVFYSLGEK